MTYTSIQIIEPILKQLDFDNARGAATYYVTLIEEYPINFEKIKEEGKRLLGKDITPNRLRKGRLELLEKGFIAQILVETGPEMYLPANPEVVWGENRSKLENLFAKDQIADQKKYIVKLREIYKKNFGKYGIGSAPNVTLRYSKYWLLRSLINNINKDTKIEMMLSGLGSFMPPYNIYYEKMLKEGLQIKALFQKEDATRIANAQKMKHNYPNNIEIKFTPVRHGTSRRVLINEEIVIDARRLLPEVRKEPSYIGTIYTEKEAVEYLKDHMKSAWERADLYSESYIIK